MKAVPLFGRSVPQGSDEFVERIVAALLPRLRELVRPSIPRGPEEAFFVEFLRDGARSGPLERTLSDARAMIRDHPYDMVLDESSGRARVPAGPKPGREIAALRREVRAMLWLAVAHEQTVLTHEQIRSFLGLRAGGDKGMVAQRVQQPVSKLRAFLGPTLAPRVISRGSDGAYLLLRGAWSMIWIRRSRDPSGSDLIYDLPIRG